MQEFIDSRPIGERTAKTEASKVIQELSGIHGEAFGNPDDYYKYCVGPMWNDPRAVGDELISRIETDGELPGWTENPVFSNERQARTMIAMMRVSCAYAIQSLKSEEMSSIAWAYACSANEWLGLALGYFSHCGRHDNFKQRAIKAAKKRHADDPKQKEKHLVFECWIGWKVKPTQYKGKAAFARDMLDKCEHLKSQKKIEDWCREWDRCFRIVI